MDVISKNEMETMLEGFKIELKQELLKEVKKDLEVQLDHNQYRIYKGTRKPQIDDMKILIETLAKQGADIKAMADKQIEGSEVVAKKFKDIEDNLEENFWNIEELFNLKKAK